ADDLVSLHHFEGGYCGISKVEDGLINVCYLVNYSSFKKYRSIIAHQQAVLYQNPHLKTIFETCVMHSEQPLSIGQISFQSKEKVKDHILMIGDTAGLIHPLCGNGMSMAIHSAKLAAELLTDHLKKGMLQRDEIELLYQKRWKETFSRRILTGRLISGMLENEKTSSLLLNGLATFPTLLKPLIRLTHGKPLMT
ncbi:MAG: FAD-dependent oxidoreductase, partial [Pedobacter sp.]